MEVLIAVAVLGAAAAWAIRDNAKRQVWTRRTTLKPAPAAELADINRALRDFIASHPVEWPQEGSLASGHETSASDLSLDPGDWEDRPKSRNVPDYELDETASPPDQPLGGALAGLADGVAGAAPSDQATVQTDPGPEERFGAGVDAFTSSTTLH
jgi:hypothetical protein